MRHFQRALEIIARALHVRIVSGYFRQNKECAARIFILFVQRLLRQLLRAFRIPRRQPLLGRDQQLALHWDAKDATTSVSEVEANVTCAGALPLFSYIDVAHQIAVCIAAVRPGPSRTLSKLRKNKASG